MHSSIDQNKQNEDEIKKIKQIKYLLEKQLNRFTYNGLCDVEMIIDNLEFFVDMKNSICTFQNRWDNS